MDNESKNKENKSEIVIIDDMELPISPKWKKNLIDLASRGRTYPIQPFVFGSTVRLGELSESLDKTQT